MSFQNLFSPTSREESAGLILAESQETFLDSHLGIDWEFSPLLGKNWDIKFLIGIILGNCFLPRSHKWVLHEKNVWLIFESQHWENIVKASTWYSHSCE